MIMQPFGLQPHSTASAVVLRTPKFSTCAIGRSASFWSGCHGQAKLARAFASRLPTGKLTLAHGTRSAGILRTNRTGRKFFLVVSVGVLFWATATCQPTPTSRLPSAHSSDGAAPKASVSTALVLDASADADHSDGGLDAAAQVVDAAADATPFSPVPFEPPFPKSAADGDGQWAPIESVNVSGHRVMATSSVHPHSFKRGLVVQVIAVDLGRVALHLVAGTREPESKAVPQEKRPGRVPPSDHDRLLAVFNGGFQAQHGHHGMMLDGMTFLSPIDTSCTVVSFQDGNLAIGTWKSLRDRESSMTFYRQSPRCLVEDGQVNPLLASADASRKWGTALNGNLEIRRSALGLDAKAKVLFFGFGDNLTPALLAEGMKAVGASHVAQLDINWSYTRFFTYKKEPGVPPTIEASLIPDIKYSPKAYVEESAPRDFFYLAGLPSGS